MAWGNQGLSHYEYGAGSWSKYFWDSSYNPGATKELCMANCTTYTYGRVRENGLPRPVTQFRDANNWHLYVNTAENWQKLDYTSGMALQPGDIVEWQANHVAVVETNGTNPYVSASWYTDTVLRTDSVSSLQVISGWMVSNVPNRFYHYVTLTTENSNAGDGQYPRYVLRYTGGSSGGDTPDVTFSPASYTTTMASNLDYIDFNYTVTVTGIPVNEDAGSGISFSNNCYRYAYTSNWQYTTYTSGGTTYRKGVRSLIVRYDRLHDYAYTDNAYMYYNKAFSNGSASGSTRMRITVEAAEHIDEDDIITFIKALYRRRKKRANIKIY